MREVAATTTCVNCGRRFLRGRYQNRFQRSGAPINATGRYCSTRCRVAAFRRRSRRGHLETLQLRKQMPSEAVPATEVRRTVTGDQYATDIVGELQTEKTVGGRSVPPVILPDELWPGMYRVRLPDGSLSDIVNLIRAKDARRELQAVQVRAFANKDAPANTSVKGA